MTMNDVFKFIVMHPDITIRLSFEEGRYLRLTMQDGLLYRTRVLTENELKNCSAKDILDFTYQELKREVDRWACRSLT